MDGIESTSPYAVSLMKKMATGDRTALTALFELFKTDVYRLSLLIVKDVQLAQDMTQEVFIKAYQHAMQYRGGNVKAWLLAIARNTACNCVKRRAFEVPAADTLFIAIPDQ